jgi:hypothetical protein
MDVAAAESILRCIIKRDRKTILSHNAHMQVIDKLDIVSMLKQPP